MVRLRVHRGESIVNSLIKEKDEVRPLEIGFVYRCIDTHTATALEAGKFHSGPPATLIPAFIYCPFQLKCGHGTACLGKDCIIKCLGINFSLIPKFP